MWQAWFASHFIVVAYNCSNVRGSFRVVHDDDDSMGWLVSVERQSPAKHNTLKVGCRPALFDTLYIHWPWHSHVSTIIEIRPWNRQQTPIRFWCSKALTPSDQNLACLCIQGQDRVRWCKVSTTTTTHPLYIYTTHTREHDIDGWIYFYYQALFTREPSTYAIQQPWRRIWSVQVGWPSNQTISDNSFWWVVV